MLKALINLHKSEIYDIKLAGDEFVENIAQEFNKKLMLNECIQCGVCTGSCPVATRSQLNVRNILREIAVFKKMKIPPEEQLWSCTTCSTCELRCPKQISPLNMIIDLRSTMVEEGTVPENLKDVLESVFKHGNPWAQSRAGRMDWSTDLNIKHISESTGMLYYIGCTNAYDTRAQEIAKALVSCLNAAEVDFGVLGKDENCCGNEILGIGELGLFELLIEDNKELFEKYNVKNILVSCPHGYNAFKNKYELDCEIQHHSQLFAELINNGKLTFSQRIEKNVAYHDPCFLGKHNGIFEEPRQIIENIPGIEFIELDRIKNQSLCCEGGGGRMWFDVSGPNNAEKRIENAIDVGAELLLTTCPFCVVTLDAAVKTLDKEDEIKVIDIAELVLESIS
jgi:Fe-S oxidoreductase